MKKHLSAIWQDSRIQAYPLDQLTPMDLHSDDRYLTRDLPRIQSQGLWYPLLIYQVDPTWWYGAYTRHRSTSCKHADPIINDGWIWAVKMGSNRYQSARDLGYTSIDCIMCEDANEAVKLGKWYAQCDPLNNPNFLPYMGLFDYEHLL